MLLSIDIEKERSYPVVKANSLIQDTIYYLPIFEYKLLMHILQKIRPDMTELQPITIDIRTFCRVCGIDPNSGKNYENTRKAALRLRNRGVFIPKLDAITLEPVRDRKGEIVLESFSWVSKVEVLTGEGLITFHLDPTLEKYLVNIGNFVTYLNAYSIYPMKSKYSARLYELLRSYSNMKSLYLSLEELHKKTTPSYPNWGGFHQRVIGPAVKDINKFSELSITYKEKMQGNRCIGLYFFIDRKSDFEENITRKHTQLLLNGYDKDSI